MIDPCVLDAVQRVIIEGCLPPSVGTRGKSWRDLSDRWKIYSCSIGGKGLTFHLTGGIKILAKEGRPMVQKRQVEVFVAG